MHSNYCCCLLENLIYNPILVLMKTRENCEKIVLNHAKLNKFCLVNNKIDSSVWHLQFNCLL